MNDFKESKIWYLKQIDIFKGVPDEEIMQIADKVIEKECKKNEHLYTPFEVNDSISILKKGEVTLYYSHYGKKLIIDVLKPGSIFGNLNFEEKPNTHFAEVTEDAYVCTFAKDDFVKVLQSKPEIMMSFLRAMSHRLTDYETRLKGGILDAKEKVLHTLDILKGKNEKSILGKLFGKNKKITHEKLAEHTGLSRETVTRAIKDLKKEGIKLSL